MSHTVEDVFDISFGDILILILELEELREQFYAEGGCWMPKKILHKYNRLHGLSMTWIGQQGDKSTTLSGYLTYHLPKIVKVMRATLEDVARCEEDMENDE